MTPEEREREFAELAQKLTLQEDEFYILVRGRAVGDHLEDIIVYGNVTEPSVNAAILFLYSSLY